MKVTLTCTSCGRPAEMSGSEFLHGHGAPRCLCRDRVFCEGCETWFDDDMAWFLHVPECCA